MIYLQTFVVRGIQALIDSAPTLLFGILAAAYLRMVVGPDGVRRLFAGEGARGLWRASLLASLAPVCSLGVLPIAREMHRAGVATAKVMSFTLAAPLLNPITLCYGWTAFDTPIFLLIVTVSFVFSFVVGGLTARWLDDEDEGQAAADPPPKTVGLRRMLNLMIASAWLSSGRVWADIGWTLLACGLAAACVPKGTLTDYMAYTNPVATPLMMAVAIPAYVSPMVGVMQVAAMSSIQFSLGAVVALHLLGVGLNGAVVRWIHTLHGTRRLISLAMVILGMTLAMGYAADALLDHPPGSEVDTHALDTLGQLNVDGSNWSTAYSHITRSETPLANYVGLGALAVLLVCGLILRRRQITHLADPPEVTPLEGEFAVDKTFAWDRPLPKPVVAGFSGVVLLSILILVVYVYYPPVQELFEEMNNVRADAVSAVRSRELQVAKRELSKWHTAADKLPVSAKLRLSVVGEDADKTARELCLALDDVRDNINGSKKEVDATLARLETAYARAKAAFRFGQGSTK